MGKREDHWFGRNIGKVIFSEDHLLKKDLRAFNPKVHWERFEKKHREQKDKIEKRRPALEGA